MPANPLAPFVASWQKRLALAQQAGVSEQSLLPVFQMDLKRLQSGTTPLTNDQAQVAIGAAAGAPPIKPPQPHADLNPLHLVENAAKDVGAVTKGIITLPVTAVKDLSHLDQMPGQIAKGAGEIAGGKVGEGLQDIARAPGLQELLLAADFIPGVDAIAAPITAGVLAAGVGGQALTPQGRQEILQHPLVAALQVLPAASELHLGAKAGALAEGTVVGDIATNVKAAGANALEHAGLGSRLRDTSKIVGRAEAQLRAEGDRFVSQGEKIWAGTTQDERVALTTRAALADPEALADPRVQQWGQLINEQDARFHQTGEVFHAPLPGGGFATYERGGAVEKAFADHQGATDTLVSSLGRVEQAKTNLELAQERVGGRAPSVDGVIQNLKPLMERDWQTNGADGKLVQATDLLQNVKAGAQGLSEGTGAQRGALESKLTQASALLREQGLEPLARQVDSIRGVEIPRAQRAYQEALDKHSQAVVDHQKSLDRYHRKLQRNPEARYGYMVVDKFHERMTGIASDLYSGDPQKMAAATDALNRGYYDAKFDDGEPVFPTAKKELRDVQSQWMDWQRAGIKPIFVHKVREDSLRQLVQPRVFPGKVPTVGVLQKRVTDLAPGYMDMGLAFSHSEMQYVTNKMAQKIIDEHIVPNLTVSSQDEVARLMKRDPSLSKEEAVRKIEEDYVPFKSSDYGVKRLSRSLGKDERLIPRHLDREMKRMIPRPENFTGVKGMWDKSIRGYRFAVTGVSPLHMAHVTFSGAMMMAGRTDPIGLMRALPETMRMIRSGEVPPEVRGASMMGPDQIITHVAATKTLSRLWEEQTKFGKATGVVQRAQDAMTRFDDHITSFYRALTYVYGGGMKDGEKGLELVGKAFVDHASLTPIERQIAKSVIPFYAWTRHLLKYAFTYPIDHPVRAGIIANLATSEFSDQLSGLPRDFAQLFFLGDKAFDIRQVNPFRDMGNDVTLAGFIGSLNPAAGGVFRALGVNPVNASGELYPELTVDPNTGKLVTQRKENVIQAEAETFIPQVQGIEGLLGFSDQLRTLHKNDPSAYWSTLARYLHFPWIPRNINIPQARASEELNVYRVSQQDVSKAMKTGDFSRVDQYDKVPFQGHLVPPSVLQSLYQLLQGKTPYTPNTLLRK